MIRRRAGAKRANTKTGMKMGVDPRTSSDFGSHCTVSGMRSSRDSGTHLSASGFQTIIFKGLVFRITASAIMFRFKTRYWFRNPVIIACPLRLDLRRQLFEHCPITNRSSTLLILREIARSFRLSFGLKSSRRVIADWSTVWFNFRPITAYNTGLRVAPNARCD